MTWAGPQTKLSKIKIDITVLNIVSRRCNHAGPGLDPAPRPHQHHQLAAAVLGGAGPAFTTGEREVGRDGERLNIKLSDLLPGTCYVIKVISD